MTKKPLPPPADPFASRPAVPNWLRNAAGRDPEFAAGAALAWIDPLARDGQLIGKLWRKRLAMQATLAVIALDGRREAEAELRDHWILRGRDDDPGPAGRLLGAFRFLGETRAARASEWPARLPNLFDLAATPDLDAALAEAARHPGTTSPVEAAAKAARAALRLGLRHRGLALWLGDAALARALGWDRPLPLLASHLPRGALRLDGPEWQEACAIAFTKGALAANDLHADLSRRALRLREVAPKLRGKDAKAVIETLQSEDAMAATAGANASDRAARRIFDRLTEFGVVRELTGRASFRLYGL